MAIRVKSISTILFDDRWEELSTGTTGSKEQHSLNSMIMFKAKSDDATIKVKIIDYDMPQKLVFRNLSRLRMGSGMMVYDDLDLDEGKCTSLERNALDEKF